MTAWMNWIRRTLGRVEKPPAISGAHSVLFVLQARRTPASLAELSVATRVPEDDLRPVLKAMVDEDSIHWEWSGPVNRQYKVYSRKV